LVAIVEQAHRAVGIGKYGEVELVVPPVNPVVDSRAKIEHGQDAGSRNSSAIPAPEDAARRRSAAAKRERIYRRCH
jgi:hypothetical protein